LRVEVPTALLLTIQVFWDRVLSHLRVIPDVAKKYRELLTQQRSAICMLKLCLETKQRPDFKDSGCLECYIV
jgi:hypothetical protein